MKKIIFSFIYYLKNVIKLLFENFFMKKPLINICFDITKFKLKNHHTIDIEIFKTNYK